MSRNRYQLLIFIENMAGALYKYIIHIKNDIYIKNGDFEA